MASQDARGSKDPKPPKPSGDDPRSGTEIRSLIGSGHPKPKARPRRPKG